MTPWIARLTLSIATLTAFAASADVDLRLARVPSTVRSFAGVTASAMFDIENVGPGVAHDVQLTVEVPDAITDAHVQVTGGTCTGAKPIRCSIPDQPAVTLLAHASLSFLAPRVAQSFTFKVTVSSAEADLTPLNNTATITFNLTTDPDLTVTFEPFYNAATRIEPGREGEVRLTASNWSNESAHDIHVRVTPPPGTLFLSGRGEGINCATDEGAIDCTLPDMPDERSQTLFLRFRASPDRNGGTETMKATITSREPDFDSGNNSAKLILERYRLISVTTTADDGPGSLRQAILAANSACAQEACKIVFELPAPPPASGWYTIAPDAPLPLATARHLVIDGASQTAFTGDTNPAGPELELSGEMTPDGTNGLELTGACDGEVLSLAVNRFRTGYGVVLRGGSGACTTRDQMLIDSSFLGTDPTGREALPNMRGVLTSGPQAAATVSKSVLSGNDRSGLWSEAGSLTVIDCLIGVAADGTSPLPNNRSGLYFGPKVFGATVTRSTIAHNFEMGVAVARGAANIDIHSNSIFANGGLGIDQGLDGIDPPLVDDSKRSGNAPTLVTARWDSATNTTIIDGTVATRPTGPYFNDLYLEVFANDDADASGFGEGQTFIGSLYGAASGPWTITVKGDYRGKWITATATRVHFIAKSGTDSLYGGDASTSEFSNAIPLPR